MHLAIQYATSKALRVDGAGPRVYALGDCANYGAGGMMDLMLFSTEIAMVNLKRDMQHFAKMEGADDEKQMQSGKDKEYSKGPGESQLVPTGRSKGVGAAFGWKLPSFMVWAIKGRDYWMSMMGALWSGEKWAKMSG